MSLLLSTSFAMLLTLISIETVLCAQTFYLAWNTSNNIFQNDNDHIIEVNKGNRAFEFDQIHIICPYYEPGTYYNEMDMEKYIIFKVSKLEYETCNITNADPVAVAVCDRPHKFAFFTISFRAFTPLPGGLEFAPGNDYYFISTSTKDDLYGRNGGRCSTNNMKIVFRVCCAAEKNDQMTSTTTKDEHNPSNGIKTQSNNITGKNLGSSGVGPTTGHDHNMTCPCSRILTIPGKGNGTANDDQHPKEVIKEKFTYHSGSASVRDRGYICNWSAVKLTLRILLLMVIHHLATHPG